MNKFTYSVIQGAALKVGARVWIYYLFWIQVNKKVILNFLLKKYTVHIIKII